MLAVALSPFDAAPPLACRSLIFEFDFSWTKPPFTAGKKCGLSLQITRILFRELLEFLSILSSATTLGEIRMDKTPWGSLDCAMCAVVARPALPTRTIRGSDIGLLPVSRNSGADCKVLEFSVPEFITDMCTKV
jgi:hypothetical protein